MLAHLFDTSDWPPRWNCGRWTESHGWLHILSDLGIWSAYVAIPLVLIYFVRKRGDLPFRSIFALFGAFILLCGTTHLMEAVIFWWPGYRLAGVIKLLTAVVSWATVFALIRIVPRVLTMRSAEELEREIAARVKAEEALIHMNAVLEERVKVRTADLTRANGVMHDERELLKTTLTSIGDAVIATDSQARVTFMNAVASNLTGWVDSDAIGRPLETVFSIVNETSGMPVDNPALRALKQGVIVGLANHTILLSKDGRRHPIDDSGAPIRTSEGHIIGAVLVFRDVAERRAQEDRVREGRERLSFALDAAALGQWDLDLSDGTTRRTPRHDQIFGYDKPLANWTFETFLEHVVPEDREAVNAQFHKSVNNGHDWDVECRIRRADGVERNIWTKARIHQDAAGHVKRMIGIIGDMTHRKQLEEDLRKLAANLSQADRRKDEFLATLAHELRNPLAPISNGLQVLRMQKNADPSYEQARSMMERQLAQMVRLVDDLLDVSRITRNKLELRRERIDLAAAIHSALESCTSIIENAGHTLTVSLPEPPIVLDADLTRLAQVFSNLLTNAAKYTERGGTIILNAYRQAGDAVISVKDNGVGIPPGMLPSIFELFTQVHGTIERAQGGLGIGLTIVRRLVEMHGGRVEARSAGPGKGSEFIVRLPISETINPQPRQLANALVVSRRKILVVDDNVDSANSLAMLLRIRGHEVFMAHDGLTAVELAESVRPDVIMLDIGLPKLNGYEACRRIRDLPLPRRPMILACTGWGQAEDRRLSREAGFDHHLTKPLDHTVLDCLLAGIPDA